MRTFGSKHFSTSTIAAALLAASAAAPLAAQRTEANLTPTARVIPARCTDAACGGDYQLAIVAALYPYDDGTVRGPSVLTLVIENRGTTPAPLVTLEATPVAHFANASFAVPRRAAVAALLPGERTVVQIPLRVDANGGVPCLAIAVSPSMVPARAQTQLYAAGAPSGARAIDSDLFPPPFVSFVDDAF